MESLREKSFVWQKFYLAVRDYTLKRDADFIKEVEGPLVPPGEWIGTESDTVNMFEPGWMRYQRGACMMSMLRSMLGGDKVLLQSITSYLTTYSYSAVVTRNFLEVLNEPAKKLGAVPANSHLRDFFEPWVNRSGFPVVYLVRNMADNTVWNMATIKQINVKGSGDPGENVLGGRDGTRTCGSLVSTLKMSIFDWFQMSIFEIPILSREKPSLSLVGPSG